jgi:hypothetical protein
LTLLTSLSLRIAFHGKHGGNPETGLGLPSAAFPFDASMEVTPVVAVTFSALAADMLAVPTMLAGFALGTFAALTFLAFPAFLAFPILAAAVIDLYDMIWRDPGYGRALKSRCRRAG